MNKPTVQDIFQCFYPAYLEKYSPSPEQAKVARNIMNCKTGAYGTNISIQSPFDRKEGADYE